MKVDRFKIWSLFNGHCAYCGCELKDHSGKHMQIDHVKPIRLNGSSNEENLFPACPKCNNYKSGNSLIGFRHMLKNTENQLNRTTAYKNAIRYGMLTPPKWYGLFYFEKLGNSK